MQVIRRPHWLLVTLVLVNAAATEVCTCLAPAAKFLNRQLCQGFALQALPLFLDRLADPVTAVLVSVVVVLIFGKQELCSQLLPLCSIYCIAWHMPQTNI